MNRALQPPVSFQRNTSSQLLAFLAGVFLLLGMAAFVYLFFFTNLLPIGGPAMSQWRVSGDFQTITDGHYNWSISYESAGETQYRGTVRHATPDRMGLYPLISHDVLVTSGDYADPSLVRTSVDILLHRFTWWQLGAQPPAGKINLLHTVPYNAEIYRQLLAIRGGDQVLISGREVDKITSYDLQDKRDMGYWKDDGCNTLVVTRVEWTGK